MSDRKPTSILWIASVVLTLIMAYLLSIGPAYRYCVRNDDRGIDTFMKVYAPVLWAIERSNAVRGPVVIYIGWWQDP